MLQAKRIGKSYTIARQLIIEVEFYNMIRWSRRRGTARRRSVARSDDAPVEPSVSGRHRRTFFSPVAAAVRRAVEFAGGIHDRERRGCTVVALCAYDARGATLPVRLAGNNLYGVARLYRRARTWSGHPLLADPRSPHDRGHLRSANRAYRFE